MKNFSVDELRGMLADIRNTEEKKNLYILVGILVAVTAVAVGIAAIFIKKHMNEKEVDDMFDDDWDDEEDDYCNCDDCEECEEDAEDDETEE